ncbi:MAG: hypothetical protein NVS3B21_04180 [Acidimicrobiales bacterium]
MATTTDRLDADRDLGSLAAGIIADEEEDAGALAHREGAIPNAPGIDDPDAQSPPLRVHLTTWGAAPLLTLAAINLIDNLDRVAFIVLGPDIKKSFHLTDTALGSINGLGALLVVVGAIPFAVLADRGNRTRLAGIAATVWVIFTFLTGVVRTTVLLSFVRLFSGLGQAAIEPVHYSLLSDYYPVEARGRVFAAHSAALPAASVAGPLLAGGLATATGDWRWAFLALAPVGLAVALSAFRRSEPSRGQMELAHHEADPSDTGGPDAVPVAPDDPGAGVPGNIPLGTAMRRLLGIATLRYLFVGVGVLGFSLVAAPVLLSRYFEQFWGVGSLGRGVIFAILGLGQVVGFVYGGVVADRLFRHNPSWPMFMIGAGVVIYAVVSGAALFIPSLYLVIVVLFAASAAVAVASAPSRLLIASTAPPAVRALAFAMLGIFILVFGGLFGGAIFGAISDATDPRVALTLLIIPGVIGGGLIVSGSRFVKDDIANMVSDLEEAARAAERRKLPQRNLLEIRNLDFSYGSVQVLFDVSLDIPEGEIVALLGTNGAGKSTVLRALSGLDHPTRGSIRFDGEDITYLETEQILSLGVAQMPGGKATFPGLTVLENLRAGAFQFRKDHERVDQDIAQVEAWFPVLGDRRNQLASTLSGGEQQMLAVGKAFLTRPRLLCIDELSLGLAPAVVELLLGIVRELHALGTTVVIVEQSVNVALSIATTAVFMEKGQVRFVGPAQDLLDRPDLLRSVFLEGAAR